MFRSKIKYRTTKGYTCLLPYFTGQKPGNLLQPPSWPKKIQTTLGEETMLSLQQWQLETMQVYKDRCLGTFLSNFVQHVASATLVLLPQRQVLFNYFF